MSTAMNTIVSGMVFSFFISVLKFVALYFVVKYAIKSALKDYKNV